MPEDTPKATHKTILDTELQSVGKVYARAVVDAAENDGKTEELLFEFDSFINEVLDSNSRFEKLLSSRLIQHEEMTGIIDRTLAARASKLFLNFLKVLSQHGRLDALRAIHAAAHERFNEMRGRVNVVVTTAAEISDDLANHIGETLRGMIGGEPQVFCRVQPDLIGGVVVQVGDRVYDGSVASQLQQTKSRMIERSVHGIQSRRDRFGTASGN